VRIRPQPQAIVDELTAGYPVLVLQNLGVAWIPFWHYAVVVGYEPDSDSFVLRSGTTERLTMSRRSFARTWARSDNWAVVMLSPGELPQTSAPEAFVEAVAGLESVGRFESALRAYRSGLGRWPDSDLLLLGFGNALYGSGEIALAIEAYQNLIAVDPDNLPGLNNLAHALSELGCRDKALAVIAQAPEAVDGTFAATLAETRDAIAANPSSVCRLN
jgi:tetratricopeptide (TPR) repeat protein